MSAFTIRPLGPEPFNAERSMPACLAMRRASGETKILSPPVSWPLPDRCGEGAAAGLADADAASGTAAGAPVSPASCFGAFCSGDGFGCSAFRCSAGLVAGAPAGTSSPSSTSMAIGSFTFTPAVPSPTRILPSTPSSTASTSIVALSVSISAMTSPAWTGSPSFFSQRASVPSVIVGLSAGIRMLVGISSSFHARAALAPLPLAALPLRRSS